MFLIWVSNQDITDKSTWISDVVHEITVYFSIDTPRIIEFIERSQTIYKTQMKTRDNRSFPRQFNISRSFTIKFGNFPSFSWCWDPRNQRCFFVFRLMISKGFCGKGVRDGVPLFFRRSFRVEIFYESIVGPRRF